MEPLAAETEPAAEAEAISPPQPVAGAEQITRFLLALRSVPEQPVGIAFCANSLISVEIEICSWSDHQDRAIEGQIALAAPVRVVDG